MERENVSTYMTNLLQSMAYHSNAPKENKENLDALHSKLTTTMR